MRAMRRSLSGAKLNQAESKTEHSGTNGSFKVANVEAKLEDTQTIASLEKRVSHQLITS